MINRVELLGRIATEVTHIEKGPGARFRMATWVSYQDVDTKEWKEIPTFHSVVAWRKQAEFLEGRKFQVGDMIYITGSLTTRERDVNGTKVYETSVTFNPGDTLKLVHRRNGDAGVKPVSAADQPVTPPATLEEGEVKQEVFTQDNLPF